jgi:hypothetical protein
MPDKSAPAPAAVPLATAEETEARVKEQAAEWGTWVAVAPIDHNGVRAYNPGDPVPSSNVERHGYDKAGSVKKIASKEAQDFVRGLHEAAQQQSVAATLPSVSLGVPVVQE